MSLSLFSGLFSRSVRFDLEGLTDWHSHILPGVDDGVQDMESSLAILEEYERAGIKKVWLTPHIMEDMPNTTAGLKECFAELRAAYSGHLELRLAAENMLDSLFEERLEHNDLLPIGGKGDHLLVETSYFNPPMGLHDILQRIMAKGYYPLLAHPERYVYMTDPDYRRLKNMGVKLQLNLLSLDGAYGKEAQSKASGLLRHGMYDCLGSDLHRHAQLERLKNLALARRLAGLLDKIAAFRPHTV